MKALASISLALCFYLFSTQFSIGQDKIILNNNDTLEVEILEENYSRVKFYLLEDDAKNVISLERKYIDRIEKEIKKKFKIYQTWISLYSRSKKLKGVLYEIQDSSVLISYSLIKKAYLSGNFSVSKIHYNDIKFIQIRRKGRVAIGAGIGGAIGIAIGIPVGYAQGDDILYTARQNAGWYAYGLGIIGAGTGALVGSIKAKIHINGSFENYDSNRNRLERNAINVLSNSHPEEPIQ